MKKTITRLSAFLLAILLIFQTAPVITAVDSENNNPQMVTEEMQSQNNQETENNFEESSPVAPETSESNSSGETTSDVNSEIPDDTTSESDTTKPTESELSSSEVSDDNKDEDETTKSFANVTITGKVDSQINPETIKWTVDANKRAEKLSSLSIIETVPIGLSLESTKVFETEVDENGNIVGDENSFRLLSTAEYSLSESGTVTVHGETESPIRVTYDTDIVVSENDTPVNPKENQVYSNTVEMASNSSEETFSATSTVDVISSASVQRAPRINQDIRTYLESTAYTTIVDSFNLTFKDADGNDVDPNDLPAETYFDFSLDYNIPNEILPMIHEGDYYIIQMDNALQLLPGTPTDFPINGMGASGPFEAGTAYLVEDEDGGVSIKLVFHEPPAGVTNVSGGIHFTGILDTSQFENPGDNEVGLPSEEDVEKFPIFVKPDTENSIDKDGYFDNSESPEKVTWEVNANKTMDTHQSLTITDNLPSGLDFDGVTVYKAQVDMQGNMVGDESTWEVLGPADYTLTFDSNGNPVVTFLNEVNYPVHLVYETTINPRPSDGNGGTIEFLNEVTMSSDEIPEELSAESSLTAKYANRLVKDINSGYNENGFEGGYNPDTQSFMWKIKYNYDRNTIPSGQVLTDTITNMNLTPGSVVIKRVNYDENGDIYETDLPAGFYTVDELTNGFKITFNEEFNFPVNIYYETDFDGIIDNPEVVTNLITDGSHNSGGDYELEQQGLVKTVKDVDHSENIITWEIVINKNNYEMHNWSMTDTFPNQEYVLGSFNLHNKTQDTDLVPDTDYTVTINNDGTNGNDGQFTLTMINDYNPFTDTLVLTYQTKFDPTNPNVSNGQFWNYATSNWEDTDGGDHTNESSDHHTATNDERVNASKAGSYNAQTKEITWKIRVNISSTNLENAYIEDVITDDQTYVWDSIEVYPYTEAHDGSPIYGPVISDPEALGFVITQPSEENGNTLRIDIPDNDEHGGLYEFRFKTSLEGHVIDKTKYYNNALFHNDVGNMDTELEAKVSVKNGDKVVLKDGEIKSNEVFWEITVNPSQSTMSNVLVQDIHDEYQIVDTESIVVYGTKVSSSGTISIDYDNVLTEGEDYTVNYFQNDNNEWELDISFNDTIDRAYVIQYGVTVVVPPGVTSIELNNSVKITGENGELIEGETNGHLPTHVGNGDAWVIGDLMELDLTKTDSVTGDPLKGAVFQLYKDEAMEHPFGGTITTDENGLADWNNLPAGTYWLYEVSAPNGYSLMNPNPVEIEIVADEDKEIDIENTPIFAEFEKQDGITETPLQGAEFALYKNTSGTWERIRENETFVTDANGMLKIYYLTEGEYYIREISAPNGYQLNYSNFYFDVIDTDGVLSVDYKFDGPIYDYKTSEKYVELIKYSESGRTLNGAEFKLEKYDEGTNTWSEVDENTRYITDSTGKIRIYDLTPGMYRLIETQAPSGFVLNPEPIEFTVDESNTSVIKLSFINYQSEVKLEKINEDKKPLSGAVFKLEKYDEDAAKWVTIESSLTTDSNGLIDLLNLSEGKYRFVETAAPDGYVLDSTPIEFEINSDRLDIEITFTNKAKSGTVTPTPTPTTPTTTGTSNISGTPSTGDTTNFVLWIVLAGISLVSAITIVVLIYRNKNQNSKKNK